MLTKRHQHSDKPRVARTFAAPRQNESCKSRRGREEILEQRKLEFPYPPRGYIDKIQSRLHSSLSPCNIRNRRGWNELFPECGSSSRHPRRCDDLKEDLRIFGEPIFSYVGLSLCIEIITVLGDFCFILVPRDLWNGMSDNLTGKPYRISCLHSSVPYSHGELRRFIFRFDAQTFNGII